MPVQRLVLLGDSILDNYPYTDPEPDTTAHLKRMLAPTWSVERLAVDGATMGRVPSQLGRLEGRPDVAVLSIGGNDVTRHTDLLDRPGTGLELLEQLLTIADDFARDYELAARAVAKQAKRTVLCTIYEVQLQPAIAARLVRLPLGVLNDRIMQIGSRLGLDVLELRSVCTDPEDFVLSIEPSAQGAEKIAAAIAAMVRNESSLSSARVYSGLDRP